jgi:hypothetical protein
VENAWKQIPFLKKGLHPTYRPPGDERIRRRPGGGGRDSRRRRTARPHGETMNNFDFVIYDVHTVFWMAFVISRVIVKRSAGKVETPAVPPSKDVHTAPWSRAMLVFHSVAFGAMYFCIGYTVI